MKLLQILPLHDFLPYGKHFRETDYSDLPPTYTFVGDIEPFYDETKEYIANLQSFGVEAKIDVYPGCFHAFDLLGSKTDIGLIAIEKYIKEYKYATKNYFSPQ